ncbi:hypothetical protein SKAU_G00022050 [Synaphobranchus kaupii]|uniref:Uncharacterized protein n=1 Tax=Synaphobranchus kaupii TaxID=118154 RepID=A0A9Q1GCI3_SYNKA|nr:hypothetical protein SKAU_G00022050 [Synaphobranchus kaupii]
MGPKKEGKNVLQYVIQMRERPEQRRAQKNQKIKYDHKARGQNFIPGQQSVDLSHLETPQQEQLRHLLDPKVFPEKPGYTTLVNHDIPLKEDAPVKQKCYRIPE